MTAQIMYASCPAVTGITKIVIDESYDAAVSRCVVTATGMAKTQGNFDTVELGEIVQVRAGTNSRNNLVFTGVVKEINKDFPSHEVNLVLYDMYVRAVDSYKLPYPSADGYDLVNGGWAVEAMVADQLNTYAFLGNYKADQSTHNPTTSGAIPYTAFDYFTSQFRYSVIDPFYAYNTGDGVKIKLKSVAQFVDEMATLLDYHVWADFAGGIHFRPRPVYPAPGDPRGATTGDSTVQSFLTFSNSNRPKEVRYRKTQENSRNKVLVKGREDIMYLAEDVPAIGSSGRPIDPTSGRTFISLVDGTTQTYPRNFSRGAFLDDNWLFSTQSQAQIIANPDGDNNPVVKAANYNLNSLRRVTETAEMLIFGDSRIHAIYSNSGDDATSVPSIVSITPNFVGADFVPEMDTNRYGNWFVHSCHHEWSRVGYSQLLTLTR